MKSIVIPYKASNSDELRYALRSLKNYKHKDLWIIGDKPDFINDDVNYLPYRQTADIAQNTLNIIKMACENPDITENFVLMHDDMYFMRKISAIPVYHRGTYDEVLEGYKNRLSNYYLRRMKNTKVHLMKLGVEKPLCYELHIPFTINKSKWLELELDTRYNKLSVYGNLHKIGGTKHKDVKVRSKNRVPGGLFVSSHESSFAYNDLGKKIRALFIEKGQYEK